VEFDRKSGSWLKWRWVVYPAIVLAVVFGSINWGLGRGSSMWEKSVQSQRETKEGLERVAIMRRKAGILDSLSFTEASEDLKLALTAVPASQKAWLLIGQLRSAGAEAGAFLESYRGSGGEAKEATESAQTGVDDENKLIIEAVYTVSGLEQAGRILASLENSLPLVRIVRADYLSGILKVGAEGAWESWDKIPQEAAELPLPDYAGMLLQMKGRLSGFNQTLQFSVPPTGGGSAIPF